MQHRFTYSRHSFPSKDPAREETFKDFDAVELYCPQCKRPVPVRKRLLLVLPEGDKYEYLCALCSTSVGTKLARDADNQRHIII